MEPLKEISDDNTPVEPFPDVLEESQETVPVPLESGAGSDPAAQPLGPPPLPTLADLSDDQADTEGMDTETVTVTKNIKYENLEN